MDNEKNAGFDDESGREDSAPEMAPRARNRTVMLTPEITGQVRARLAQDPSERAPSPEAHGGGFVPVAPRRAGAGSETGHDVRRPAPNQPVQQTRAVPAPKAPEGDCVVWTKPSVLVGFLVTFDNDPNGEFYVLRSGRLIVTSEVPSGGNYLFIDDDTVSPMHAIVRIGENGEIQVLDQLSECGSGVHRCQTGEEVELSGDKCALGHGDTIRFGKRSFQVCLMPKVQG